METKNFAYYIEPPEVSLKEERAMRFEKLMEDIGESFEYIASEGVEIDADLNLSYCLQLGLSDIDYSHSVKVFFKEFVEIETLTLFINGAEKEADLQAICRLGSVGELIDRVVATLTNKNGSEQQFIIRDFCGFEN